MAVVGDIPVTAYNYFKKPAYQQEHKLLFPEDSGVIWNYLQGPADATSQ